MPAIAITNVMTAINQRVRLVLLLTIGHCLRLRRSALTINQPKHREDRLLNVTRCHLHPPLRPQRADQRRGLVVTQCPSSRSRNHSTTLVAFHFVFAGLKEQLVHRRFQSHLRKTWVISLDRIVQIFGATRVNSQTLFSESDKVVRLVTNTVGMVVPAAMQIVRNDRQRKVVESVHRKSLKRKGASRMSGEWASRDVKPNGQSIDVHHHQGLSNPAPEISVAPANSSGN
ncbi:hypothetical protein RB6378 [Rhodopirellula baltica SH 1]|uniref:Uncharacterized protein n=2 Tax=Rhodopirellula baltica TaxID=265606 RepID=Q7UQE2_RHOBA|nr:hypothetical protein RB6378 [Rhodopirellula baltica SH 1]